MVRVERRHSRIPATGHQPWPVSRAAEHRLHAERVPEVVMRPDSRRHLPGSLAGPPRHVKGRVADHVPSQAATCSKPKVLLWPFFVFHIRNAFRIPVFESGRLTDHVN